MTSPLIKLKVIPQGILLWLVILGLLIPNVILCFTGGLGLVGGMVNILLPLGLWLIALTLGRRPGRVVLVYLPWMLFVNAVQFVLLMVFDGAVISVDLLLSLFSASSDEAGELLGGLILPIIFSFLIHALVVVVAWASASHSSIIPITGRKRFISLGLGLILLSLPLALWANRINPSHTLRGDIYPINVFYNTYIAVSKLSQLAHLDETSSGHDYKAHSDRPDDLEVYVFVLGETSRAYSHALYGYPRDTNPHLSRRLRADSSSLLVFADVLTQSNTTSKSAPIILSPADAENSDRLPYVRGIFSALKQAGFYTVFISNQPENRSFLDHFAYEADKHYRIRDIIRKRRGMMDRTPIYDGEMIPFLDEILKAGHRKLFVIMHGYGAHWSYPDRYPKAFAYFTPDDPFGANPLERNKLINAYDNAIRYNDHFLNEVIKRLEVLPHSTAMYYTSDHGEDVYDDTRERILHSTPTVSYYQLHVPAILWLSPNYRLSYPAILHSALANRTKAATSRSNFHTLLQLSGVATHERVDSLSLLSPLYREHRRTYLNDRYECVPFGELIRDDQDKQMWQKMRLRSLD